MLPEIIATDGRKSTHDAHLNLSNAGLTCENAATRLDEILWRPRAFRLLTAANMVVAAVFPRSAAEALGFLGQGEAVAVMGELRPGVGVVDIDLSGELAVIARDSVLDWARGRGHATIVRPSGAPGHAHVLIAGADQEALERFCAEVRRDLGGLAYGKVDPRPSGKLRTLTSPHRHGRECGPISGDVEAFLEAAQAAITAASPTHRRESSTSRLMSGPTGGRVVATRGAAGPRPPLPDPQALIPRPRRYRDLPEHIAAWLATGREWAIAGGSDHSRSTREAIATAFMVRAGWSHEQAWTAILTAHPEAMVRARASRRRWTLAVWNPAVQDNEDAPAAAEPLPQDMADDIVAARLRLDRAARLRLPPRARATVLLVGDAVVDMWARKRTRRVGVAARLLHEDLALSLHAIGRALRWLHDNGVLHLDTTTLDRRPSARATTSYEAVLPTGPGTAGDVVEEDRLGVVREMFTPGSHTPLARAGLPVGSNQILRVLRCSPAVRVEELAPAALLTVGVEATVSELRTTRDALRALQEVGLVQVDIQGRWSLSESGPDVEYRQRAAQDRARRTAQITAERRAYRSAARPSEWEIGRAVARKKQIARRRAWWNSLTREEQTERRAEGQMRYAALSLGGQLRVREDLARRRAREGVDEQTFVQDWIDSWSPQQWADRVAMRAAAHWTKPAPERAAIVAGWEHHRARWGLTRGRRSTPAHDELTLLTPAGAPERDDRFIQAELDLDTPTLAPSGTTGP